MGRGTPTTARRTRQPLREQTASPSARVDRSAGVIFGVKVLGLESANGRRYTPECLKKAVRLYQKRSVRIDHPANPDDQRPTSSVFGWLEAIELKADGLYGDLHFLKSHPMAGRVCEVAERNATLLGLSHNAEGSGQVVEGVFVVEEITEVRSVDVVADPATTRGLFESKQQGGKPMRWSAWMEAVIGRLPDRKRRAKALLRLEEMCKEEEEKDLKEDDGLAVEPGPDMEAPPESGDPDAALKDGFVQACTPLLHAALDGDAEALKKLNDYVKTHSKMSAKAADAAPVAEEDEEDDKEIKEGEDEDEEDKMEARKRKGRLDALGAIRLCEAASISYDSTLLECLCAASSDDSRRQIIEREKKRASDERGSKVRTQVPGKGGEHGEGSGPSNWAALAEARSSLKRGA